MDHEIMSKGCPVVIKIDPETLEALKGKKISMSGTGYPQVCMGGRVQSLHRWMMGLPISDPRIVDHINRDRLDNRRSNLRVVTPTGSNLNRVVKHGPHGCGVKKTKAGRFGASVKRATVVHRLGTHDTQEAAQEAIREFLKGPITPERAKGIADAAIHTHTPQGVVKCPRCRSLP